MDVEWKLYNNVTLLYKNPSGETLRMTETHYHTNSLLSLSLSHLKELREAER